MDASKDTIVVNANVEMTTRSLQTIVENAKKRLVVMRKGFIELILRTRSVK